MEKNKVSNPQTEVPENTNMNDRDYLNDVLQQEKNLSNNLSIAASEASNTKYYKEVIDLFLETKNTAHDLYNLMFKNGWYSLDKATEAQINQKYKEFQKRCDNELK